MPSGVSCQELHGQKLCTWVEAVYTTKEEDVGDLEGKEYYCITSITTQSLLGDKIHFL